MILEAASDRNDTTEFRQNGKIRFQACACRGCADVIRDFRDGAQPGRRHLERFHQGQARSDRPQ